MRAVTKLEFFTRLLNKYGNKFELLDEYVDMDTKIHFLCHDCNNIIFTKPNDLMRRKYGCRTCSIIIKNTPIVGVEDLWTTHPNVAMLLKNSEDGYKYSYGSNKKACFKCPVCGYESNKFIYAVVNDGFSCTKCSDGISYPNKFFRSLFDQLDVVYIPEWSPDFIAPMAYDFYFKINNKKYVVEADGGLGHGNQRETSMAKYTKEDSIAIDSYKDMMANNYNVQVIRIDCNYHNTCNRDAYIKNHIIDSDLARIFDLSYVDWKKCDMFATSSLVHKAAELWDSGICLASEIAKILNLTSTCVISYLKISEKLNLSSYKHNDYVKNSYVYRFNKTKPHTIIPVQCIETQEIFSSEAKASKKYKCDVSAYLRNRCKYAGKLDDGTELHWKKMKDL